MRQLSTDEARRIGRGVARRLRRGARRVRDHTPLWRLSPPTVSIVVPFYNVEDYLGECLDSIAAQTFGHYEVLLVDDGSPDGSRLVAERHAKADPRLRIVTRENGGLGAARNSGVRKARGRFLTFVDSDDLLPEHALEVMVGSAKRTGSDIVTGGVRRFDPHRSWRPAWVRDVHLQAREGVTDRGVPRRCCATSTRGTSCSAATSGPRSSCGSARASPTRTSRSSPSCSPGRRASTCSPMSSTPTGCATTRSSISQQTASLKDLRDRVDAWHATRTRCSTRTPRRSTDAWLLTLFRRTSTGTSTAAARRTTPTGPRSSRRHPAHAGRAPGDVGRDTDPDKRVLLELAGRPPRRRPGVRPPRGAVQPDTGSRG